MSVAIHIKKFAGESFIYGMSGIISRFISVFLFPFFTRVLSPHDYGTVSILNSIYFVINVVAILGLNSAAFRWFYNSDKDDERKSSITSWFWCELSMSALIAVLFFLLNDQLENLFFEEVSGHHYFYYIGFALLLNVIPSVAVNYYRIRRQPVQSVTYSLVSTFINIAANIFLVIYLRMGVQGMLLAQVISSGCGSVIGLFSFGNWLTPFKFNLQLLKQMLRYGIPLMPSNLSATFTILATNFILQQYAGTSEVGFYQVATTIASGLTLFTAAFGQAWSPFSLSILHQNNANEIYRMSFRIYFILFTILALVVAVFAKEIILVLATPVYLPSALIAGLLCFSNFINGLSVLAFTGLSIRKQTGGYAIVTVLSAITTIGFLWLLIPLFGTTGAAVALLLCQMITPVYLFYQSEKVYPIHFPYRFGALTVSLAIILFLISFYISLSSVAASLLLKIFIVLGFIGVIYYSNAGLFNRFLNSIRKPFV